MNKAMIALTWLSLADEEMMSSDGGLRVRPPEANAEKSSPCYQANQSRPLRCSDFEPALSALDTFLAAHRFFNAGGRRVRAVAYSIANRVAALDG